MLPLQTTWAGVAHCPRGEHHDASVSMSDAASHPEGAHRHGDGSDDSHGHPHGDPDGTDGHGGGARGDCSLFQFVAMEPLVMVLQWLPQPGAAIAGIALPGYKSHIPDGLDRPNWRFAAGFGETLLPLSIPHA